MTTPVKAKRKLSNIDFSGDNAHIALVTASQGGPANGAAYKLIMKAEGTTPEVLEKMQAVKVTLDTPDFLEQFFGLYEWDAELLAAILGYVDDDDAADSADGVSQGSDWIDEYVAERLPSFEVMKSLRDSNDIPAAIALLTDDERLQFLKDQAVVEKALRKKSRIDKQKLKNEKLEKAVQASLKTTENKNMTDAVKTDVVDVQKSLEDAKAELLKAKEQLAAYETEKKEAIVKAKTSKIQEITKAAAELKDTEILVKAGLALDEADYIKYTAELTSMVAMIEKSAMFKETGVTTDPVDTAPKNGVMDMVKSLVAKQNK